MRRDGGRLRSGAAALAAESGLPIVPVHISGTSEVVPIARHWLVRLEGCEPWSRHTIAVRFPDRSRPRRGPLCGYGARAS
jgi:1-acyl-sn-glycerol-3-phosphate acyltransferase